MKRNNTNINLKERSVEEYKVLAEIYNANWRDDIEAEAKEIDKIKKEFQFFEKESDYDSRKNVVKDAERIAKFRMARKIRNMALQSMKAS